ncbi:MAG: SIR2 family protein [Phycisphaerales bacterium]|nr:SIR2 family protein [Phycisphaerales bacterium]
MSPGTADCLDELWTEIEGRRHRHLLFLVGSLVSRSPECHCASVPEIRDALVLASVLKQTECSGASTELRVAVRACLDNPEWKKAVSELPFEQFMGCLDAANPHAATAVVRATCGGSVDSRPNHLHRLVIAVAQALVDREWCEAVTLATTNYDRCLEIAAGISVPAPSRTLGGQLHQWIDARQRGLVQLLKLHGCVSEPASCVYTTHQLARTLFLAGRLDQVFQLLRVPAPPSLWVVLGYGFRDPDLRPLFSALLNGDGARERRRVFWNEPYWPVDPSFSGPEVLRASFLTELNPTVHSASLFGPIHERGPRHILVDLAHRLGLDAAERDVPEYVSAERLLDARMKLRVDEALRSLSSDALAEFVARITDSACRSDAIPVLRPLVFGDSAPPPAVVRLYLEQFGHGHDCSAQAAEAVRVRRAWPGTEVELIARAFESFALTLPGSVLAVPQAVWTLRRGRRLRTLATRATRAFFEHYRLHLWCKVVQAAGFKTAPLLHRLGLHRILAAVSARLAQRLGETQDVMMSVLVSEDAPGLLEVRDVAATSVLHGQALLVRGNGEGALKRASEGQVLYSVAGWLNGTSLADRTRGWALLAQGEPQRAARILAAALDRALGSADPSLGPKMALDMLRALRSAGCPSARISESMTTAEPASVAAMRSLLRRVHDDPAGASDEDASAIAALTRQLYPERDWERLDTLIERSLDASIYPVFLAPVPAPTGQGRREQPCC